MTQVLKVIFNIILFVILTAITQIGGCVLLLSFLAHPYINRKVTNYLLRITYKSLSFILLYLIFTFLIVPFIAKPLGRVPLPISTTNNVQPLNIITCLLNRNYVKPALKEAIFDVATQMNKQFPETKINYLDANFPFIDKFPLLPHLSHNDGKKLDLSFCYTSSKTDKETNDCPAFLGYGICEEPNLNEINTAATCEEKGYWQYSFLEKIVPQGNKANYILDKNRTRTLIKLICAQASIGKIFIEPHLKQRLKLKSDKIKFHGCQAVRHDDHIHIQLD